jgi:[acyl-carrier-protein] S-malonyltransferase
MMGKTAFIFPGQGSQYAGMGKEIRDAYSCARHVFAEADQALGISISALCFEGPEESLRLTRNTQPAILAVSVAILAVLQERRFCPDYVAGHSLGEYSALVCAGALSLTDAVRVVQKRGAYMQEAVPPGMGAMAAILGLDAEQVIEVCLEAAVAGQVSPANFNAPDQTVIAGEAAAVQLASEKSRARGAKRVMPLAVSAPFHCGLMAPARKRLSDDLQALSFRDLDIPLICNVDAAPVSTGAAARDALLRQVCAPVRWVESVRHLADCGVDTFIEVGPGRVLSGLVRKIFPQAKIGSVEGIRGIEALASLLTSAKM